jgi:tryptophan synthase alpha chain
LINVFLITPQTSEERIHFIDSVSGFTWRSASVTGSQTGFGDQQAEYFQEFRI